MKTSNCNVKSIGRYSLVVDPVSRKKAIKDEETNEIVSLYWPNILNEGVLKGKSEYYIIDDHFDENIRYQGIFHINGKHLPISGWYEDVSVEGLVSGESDYFVGSEDGLDAIYNIERKRFTKFWDLIFVDGVVSGESDYYIAKREDGKEAIFHIDNKNTPVSKWWDFIYSDGLVNGESDYYKAERISTKKMFILFLKFFFFRKNLDMKIRNFVVEKAVFHVSDKYNPIFSWKSGGFGENYDHGQELKNKED